MKGAEQLVSKILFYLFLDKRSQRASHRDKQKQIKVKKKKKKNNTTTNTLYACIYIL